MFKEVYTKLRADIMSTIEEYRQNDVDVTFPPPDIMSKFLYS